MALPYRTTDPAIRFFAKVDKSGPVPEHRPELGPCWLWTASKNGTGYGAFCVYIDLNKMGRAMAHRWSYEHHKGPIPAGKEIHHICGTPACVNPDHLEPVTRQENLAHGTSFAARHARQTHCWRGHEFNDENSYVNKSGRRVCRACNRLRLREHIARKKGEMPAALNDQFSLLARIRELEAEVARLKAENAALTPTPGRGERSAI
ncbi:MAG TPA: HNH endonuclease signature motif containing protein [Rhodothermales bacterium]|nr:HNH endonuclease signature motif containing protein [Rhodothermales bacterium]